MKRLLIWLITMGMTLGAVGSAEATEAQRSDRTVEGRYGPNPSPVTGCNEVLGPWACLVVHTDPTEQFFAAKVTDTHGLPVYFSVMIPRTGFFAEFCGETAEPVAFPAGHTLEIEVGVSRMVTQTLCPQSSVKTTGTIAVTLSDQR